MEKKAKAEAKRARRKQRKLEGGANHSEEAQDVELNTPETDSINSEDAK